MPRVLGLMLGALALTSSLVYIAACSDDTSAVKEQAPDSGFLPDGAPIPVPEGGTLPDGALPDGAPGDCFMNPTNHFEIINACTDAVKITKNPTLPLLLADGGLPTLP
jgi:hypothetical protein